MLAVLKGSILAAPTVGTWRPRVGLGAPLVAGEPLGVLLRAGRTVEVRAPDGAHGVVATVLGGGWVAYGAPLITMGEAFGLAAAAAAPHPDAAEAPAGVRVVRAETDGTVYLRPEPGAAAFAAIGASVSAHQTVALIEVMKTFNPVRAPVAGVIERALVADAAAVSAGDPLLWVRVAGDGA